MKHNPKEPFNYKNIDPSFEGLDNFSREEFTKVMEQMIEKGLVSSFQKDGEVYYQLTDFGFAVGQHLNPDPKMVN